MIKVVYTMSPLLIFVSILYFIQDIHCGPIYGPPYPFDRITLIDTRNLSTSLGQFVFRPLTKDENSYMVLYCIKLMKQKNIEYCGKPKSVLVSSSSKAATPTSELTTSGPTPGLTTSGPTPGLTTSRPTPGLTTSGPIPGLTTLGPTPGLTTSEPTPGLTTAQTTTNNPIPSVVFANNPTIGTHPIPAYIPTAAASTTTRSIESHRG